MNLLQLMPAQSCRYASRDTYWKPHIMQLLDELSAQAKARNMPFLVVGGHALNAYGVGRQTADLDLLVCLEDADVWQEVLTALGFRLRHRHQAFLQFEPSDPAQWPIDLLLVDRPTFSIFDAAGTDVSFDSASAARVPSALHLIALKLHALKQAGMLREAQDIPDIAALIKLQAIDPSEPGFRDYCLKYGNAAIYERIVQQTARSG